MKFDRSLLFLPLFIAACSSAPKGGEGDADSVYPTSLYKPAQIDGSRVADLKYAKDWVGSVGGGFDDFKKVTIPAYTIEFKTTLRDVNQNKFTTMLGNSDGDRNVLDMAVVFPAEQHADLLREITNESYARLKGKLAKLGFELVEWSDVKAKSEDAREFEKERLDMTPVAQKGDAVSIAAEGRGRLSSIFWPYGASSTARDSQVMLLFPHFTVGYGYFGGEATPQTVKEAHSTAYLQFTPQVQIYQGSGLKAAGKYESGRLELDQSAVTNHVFVTKLEKAGDSKADAKDAEEQARRVAAMRHGTHTGNIQGISSRAGVGYDAHIDPVKFKTAVMEQLNWVEDMVVERFKNEL